MHLIQGLLSRSLSDDEQVDWLRLIRSENVGPITFFQLLEHYHSAAEAIKHLPELASRGGRRKSLRVCSRASAEDEISTTVKLGGRLIACCEPDFPDALRVIAGCPPLIAVMGHPHLMRRNAVAIVGARNASLAGRRYAQRLAYELGEAGYVIVSGMASGIDTAAHQGSLAAGSIAVLGNGLDVIYPHTNRNLYHQLKEQGLLLTEHAPGIQPRANLFPSRNRLISGLSLGVVVVEATLKSGSLITAQLGLEQGREVFAVPGSPMDPRSQGPNKLLREGAILTESTQDIIDGLNFMTQRSIKEQSEGPPLVFSAPRVPPDEAELSRARVAITQSLGHAPLPVDNLVRGHQFAVGTVMMVLLELELAGRLERHPGKQVSLVSP